MWSTNDPEWGILSTPVVSDDKTTLFVVAWHDDGAEGLQYRLHALDLKNGTHRQPPVASARLDRPAALPAAEPRSIHACTSSVRRCCLHDGIIYVGFGGDGNRGALFAFDAQTPDAAGILELDADR